MAKTKKLLLIDLDDVRRKSRPLLLTNAGYTVDLRDDYTAAERLDREGAFDLIILALHRRPDMALAYSDHLSQAKPRLPILLLTDSGGVCVPRGTLSPGIETGDPTSLIHEVTSMLEGSTQIRELPIQEFVEKQICGAPEVSQAGRTDCTGAAIPQKISIPCQPSPPHPRYIQ
ncbi:MAG TPA: hypothetical protein VME18_10465 [Acidobacteriaceae bacterium]|nr:hypothetical protein [Acidobacteriaceae bacterium]